MNPILPFFLSLILVLFSATTTTAQNKVKPKICGVNEMLVHNKCLRANCKGNAKVCKRHNKYCITNNMAYAVCSSRDSLCHCLGFYSIGRNTKLDYCEKDADCLEPGLKCNTNNFCAGKPTYQCITLGQSCKPNDPKYKCCSHEKSYCHTRYGPESYKCFSEAFVGEACGKSNGGMPCEAGSTCIQGKCALRHNDSCDTSGAVCSNGLTCKEVPYWQGANKLCLSK